MNINLTEKATSLRESLMNTLNLVIKQQYNTLEDIASIREDDLQGMKAVNDTIEKFNEYLDEHANAVDEMAQKLDDIQKQMINMSKHLDSLADKE